MLRQSASVIDKFSPAKEKVKLYQSLFQGRTDVEHLFVLKGGMGKKQLKHIMEEINDSKIDSNIVILAIPYFVEGNAGTVRWKIASRICWKNGSPRI